MIYKNQKHFKNYLKLRRKEEDPPVIIYLKDENGNPILDHNKISIIQSRTEGSDIVLAFDSKNQFNFIRYEVLEKYSELKNFKEFVDKKISDLENKADSEEAN